jgi:hypothetical protein
MVLKQMSKEHRIELVAEIIAKGKRTSSLSPDSYLMNLLELRGNAQSLIDSITWTDTHKNHLYWLSVFNQYGSQQR